LSLKALPDYSVISPVKDEAQFLATTARSLISQTHRPTRWVIVDDGSTDETREIAEAFAREHDWISVIDSGKRQRRARGAPIVAAFNAGLATLEQRTELLVKMDGDLFLPSHYFEWVAETFARDERAGIVGGVVFIYDGSRWFPDPVSRHTVHGVAKTYRAACLDAIGGLRESMGWDGIDEHGARARGWQVRVLSELTILHYKQRGSRQKWYRARWEEGRGANYMGYHPAFVLIRAAYRMVVEPPPVVGGLALLAGYLQARLTRAQQIDDPAARASLRAEQEARMRGLLRGRRHVDSEPLPGGGPALWEAADASPPSPAVPAG